MNDMIDRFELPMVMGRWDDGTDRVADLASFPHILIGGMAGSGKSSFLRSALAGFIQNRSPEELKLIIYDGNACEWMDIKPTFPYLLAPVMTQNLCCVLAWSVREIERRQKLFEQAGCSGLCEFNRRDASATDGLPKTLPRIVIVMDDIVDLMWIYEREVAYYFGKIARYDKAQSGIHLIYTARRRPYDSDRIWCLMEDLFGARLAFKVPQKCDSQMFVGDDGAAELDERGSFLLRLPDGTLERGCGAYISEEEWQKTVADKMSQYGSRTLGVGDFVVMGRPWLHDREYLYKRAVEICRGRGKVTTAILQRELEIGYRMAEELVNRLKADGLVKE